MIDAVDTINSKVYWARFVMNDKGSFQRHVVMSAEEVLDAYNKGDWARMEAAGFDHETVEQDWD